MSCFEKSSADAIGDLDEIIAQRAATADSAETKSYTQRLLGDRNLRLKKIGEESAELVVALADSDTERAKEEAADLLYHVLVALRPAGISFDDVRKTLAARRSVR